MKLTKKIETEIWKIYDTWMQGYLNADVDTYNYYFDEDYHFIGSTNNEEFLNKKDTTDFFRATGDQFAGMTDLRRETKTLEVFGEHVFLTHFFDAWFKNDTDWSYYGRFRFSSVMHKTKEGWRFIYQHFSMPDSKSEEGQTIGFDKVHLENQELREAIQRRTTELEQKNRELEVETALERIRAQAVAMKESTDLLDIVVTMRNEFIKLGHEAHYFWHMMWLPETYEKAMTSGDGSKIGFVMKLPRHIHGDIPLLAKWEKSKKPTVVYAMNVDEALDYVNKMITLGNFQNIDPQAPKEEDIRHIGGLTFIMARTTHGEIGYSLPGIVKNPPKEDLDILVQFASAFDLAHRRFLDLQKAEKQAREVQIELALEKVRSRTMGMQRSVELRDTSMLLFQQVEELGINSFACGFNIWDEDKKFATAWMASKDRLQHPFKTNSAEDVYVLFHEAEKRGESLFILEHKGKELEEHYKYLVTIPEIKKQSEAELSFPTFQIIHCAYFSKGYLMFITLEPVPDAHDIFKRFAKVFEQTYTRFLDLQKAEKQAREKEIELALEKVRSRTMAMQHSDELAEASFLLDEQVRALGIKTWGCAFNIYGEKESTEWFGNEAGVLPTYTVPHKGIFKEYYQKGQKGESFFIKEFSGKACVDHYEYMSSLPVIGNVLKNLKKTNNGFPTYQIDHVAYFKYGYLLFITKEHAPDAHDVFKRFAKVFEQTYTRFLDLQKAEAQAKEAQIEASLERVRSRSMAMQKSDELRAVVSEVFEKLKGLNIAMDAACIYTFTEGSKDRTEWVANTELLSAATACHVPFTNATMYTEFMDAWEQGQDFFIRIWTEEEKNAYWKLLFEHSDYKNYPDEVKKIVFDSPGWGVSGVISKNSATFLVSYSEKYFSEEENEIVKRFGKVFEQAYVRFLDLQKAEAQAREAQIEAALERVRAQSNAMHQSEDLANVVTTVYEELKHLDSKILRCGIGIINEKSKNVNTWITSDLSSETSIELTGDEPLSGHPLLESIFDYWKKQENLLYLLEGKDLIEYYKTVINIDFQKHFAKEGLDNAHVKHYYHCTMFPAGGLYVFKTSPISKEQINVLQRFADAFNRAYTRHQDLQKAEAQAREAQIETALERVRSRSMAMHNSNEIGDVAVVLFEQLTNLGGELWGTGFGFCKENSTEDEFWFVNQGGIMPFLKIPHTEDPTHKAMYKGWQEGLEILSIEKDGKELENHYNYMLSVPAVKPMFQGILDEGISFPKWQKWHAAYFKFGYQLVITTKPYEDEVIFKRFVKVFEQAYTRFLDLQKAEAQAREAQIEAALERIRSQSMGMQTSKDLSNVTTEMFNQLRQFGGELFATGIVFCDKLEGHVEQWHSIPNTGMMSPFIVPIDLDYIHQYRYDQWKKGIELFSIEIPSDFIEQHFNDIFNLPSAQKVLKDFENQNTPMPGAPPWEIDYGASFKYGYILVSSLQPFKEAEILPRFAKVFEQTYTRFLDLQKAEAQAREAQIEAALEKVRSRTMAMQKGEEIKDVVVLLYKELIALGVTNFATCGYVEINKKTNRQETWVTSPGGDSLGLFYLPLTGDKVFDERYEAWKNQQIVFHQTVAGKERREHLEYAITTFNSKEAEEMVLNQFPDPTVFYCFNFSHGYLHLVSGSYLKEEEESLLARFTNVFEQTYARFLDLKKAEAQAREAQIETALERVRSRSMAMHNSEELKNVVKVIFDQMAHLKINAEHAGIVVDYEPKKDWHFWVAETQDIPAKISVPYSDNVWDRQFTEAKKNGKALFTTLLNFEEKNTFYKKLLPHIEGLTQEMKDHYFKRAGLAISTVIQKDIGLYIENFSGIPFSAEENNILMRFAKVFQQSYTRFLDLQKAEAQARESQIEAALEKVRSRSLSMHQSEELWDVISEIFLQLEALKIQTDSCFINIKQDNLNGITFYAAAGGQTYKDLTYIPYGDFKIFNRLIEAREKGESFFSIIMDKEEKDRWWKYFFAKASNIKIPIKRKNYLMKTIGLAQSVVLGEYASIHMMKYVDIPYLEEENQILMRFGKAFDQVYIRFLDLQKAEAQARESQIEAALEKVRSRTMAMQHSDELPEAANNLFLQVQALGIPAWSAGYCIWEDDHKKSTWCNMSSEGEIQKAFSLPTIGEGYDFNSPLKKGMDFYVAELGGEAIVKHYDFMKTLPIVGEVFDDFMKKGISLPTFQVFHIVFFTHGYLMFITYEPVKDQWDVFKRFGKVFQQTYTRFLDLKLKEDQAVKLEEEKERLEVTISELKATQSQLIQSEKMASLGELTAGIAHEIQNPLNFVNNFSEVSKELLDEMFEEMENGDMEEVKAIMDDVIQNLEKINHHGKRADGIVKGMLQHSRASGDKKEPTDINVLADEYLRLAYHGLRAKDKSFNATLETNYDDSIENINIIPQDIGRVVLNLLTNAFYVVNEKKQANQNGYEPTVALSTKKNGNWVTISVKDNGNGVPKKVLDKIFQPFFTTKPTGQGTGLGLSMSYDIVTKGHGGELIVNTKESMGTEFIIKLPI